MSVGTFIRTALPDGFTDAGSLRTGLRLAPEVCIIGSGAGGAVSSALLLGLDDVPASPAASRLASEAAARGANVIVITNTST